MAQGFKFKLTLDKKTLPNPKRIMKQVNEIVSVSVDEIMKEVFDQSQELVPVKTGALKASGVFTPASENADGEKIKADIKYGNPSVTYAVEVHEDLSVFHKPPTQAKYLETPMAQNEQRLRDAAKQALVEGVKKGMKRK
jgi:hypothetical protein